MKSYIKLMEEVDKLQQQRKNIEVEKLNILMPLYEIQNKYEKSLGEILPKNIYSITSKNLELRIGVLEEEIKDLDISEDIKEKLIKIISNAKEKYQEKNNEITEIDNIIISKGPEIQQRKEYVIEKAKQKEEIEKEIYEIQSKIDERYSFLEKENWDQEVITSINGVIAKLKEQVQEKLRLLNILLMDEELMKDIEVLAPKKVQHEIVQETYVESKNENEEKTSETEKIEEIIEEEIKEIKEVVEPDNNEQEIIIDSSEEQETITEQQNAFEEQKVDVPNKSLKDQFYDALVAAESIDLPIDDEVSEEEQEIIKIFSQKETDAPKEEVTKTKETELTADEVHSNEQLEEQIKTNKKDRIKLGVQMIIAKLFYNPQKIMDESDRLGNEVGTILHNNREEMTIEDAESIREKAIEINKQKEKTIESNNQLSELKKLSQLNSSLDRRLDTIYLKDEFGEYDKPLVRIK